MAFFTMVFVLVLYGFLDSAQDKLNSAKYKRNPGVPKTWYNYMPRPFYDLWHLVKRTRLYLLPVYILALWVWPEMIPEWQGWFGFAVSVGFLYVWGWITWKLIPNPEWWFKTKEG